MAQQFGAAGLHEQQRKPVKPVRQRLLVAQAAVERDRARCAAGRFTDEDRAGRTTCAKAGSAARSPSGRAHRRSPQAHGTPIGATENSAHPFARRSRAARRNRHRGPGRWPGPVKAAANPRPRAYPCIQPDGRDGPRCVRDRRGNGPQSAGRRTRHDHRRSNRPRGCVSQPPHFTGHTSTHACWPRRALSTVIWDLNMLPPRHPGCVSSLHIELQNALECAQGLRRCGRPAPACATVDQTQHHARSPVLDWWFSH